MSMVRFTWTLGSCLILCLALKDTMSVESDNDKNEKEVLALPSPDDAGTISLDVSTGQPVTLDQFGPVIVTEDGKLRRITNWDTLTEKEKQVTIRRISARNKKRLAALREAQENAEAETNSNKREDL
eukprot:m.19207 g.19207  ORF g.19207 m.19207 type:complete len:127 (+) comp6509_c0_seq2:296-676(+)